MSTYNFTVRATDNAGAFSDRTFSLNVNDTVTSTQYDRFVIAGTTGVARSVDGSTWVVDPLTTNNTYGGITYGNGKWVQWSGNSIRTADTGLSWTSAYQPAYNSRSNGYTSSTNVITCVKYVNNIWRLFAYNSGTSGYIIDEYTSTDLVNWSLQRFVSSTNTGTAPTDQGLNDFDYDPISDVWVAIATVANTATYVFSRSGNNAWSIISGFPTSTVNSSSAAYVKCTNGFWTISSGVADTIFTSQDGVNWTARTPIGYASLPFAMTYQNGRILAFPIPTTTATTTPYGVRESRDGGRMWTARSAEATTGYPLRGFVRTTPSRLNIASYAGTTVMVTPQANTVVVSSDEFATFNTVTLTGLGTPITAQARDS